MKRNSIKIFLSKQFFAFKRNRKTESGVSKVADSHSDEEGSSVTHRHLILEQRDGWMGICSVIEEEDRRYGMALAEFRSELILCLALEKFGLL